MNIIGKDRDKIDYNIQYYLNILQENRNIRDDCQVFSSPQHTALICTDRILFEVREHYLTKNGISKDNQMWSIKNIFKMNIKSLINYHKPLKNITVKEFIDEIINHLIDRMIIDVERS